MKTTTMIVIAAVIVWTAYLVMPWVIGVQRHVSFDLQSTDAAKVDRFVVCLDGRCNDYRPTDRQVERITADDHSTFMIPLRMRPGWRNVAIQACHTGGCSPFTVGTQAVKPDWTWRGWK